MASRVTIPPANSNGRRAGRAVIAWDFEFMALGPSTWRFACAKARTRCRGGIPSARLWALRTVLSSRVVATDGIPSRQQMTNGSASRRAKT